MDKLRNMSVQPIKPPLQPASEKSKVGRIAIGLLLLALLVAGIWLWRKPAGDEKSADKTKPVAIQAADYVGSEACGSCHKIEFAEWRQSQHAKAMQHANAATVLGDFNDASYLYNGITTRFFMKGGRFFVNTDGPDGQMADYEIGYTFGLDPMQQYLIEFSDGRMQALSIAWDTRPAEQGGQRWFHLQPDQKVDFKDELHWTKRTQNWNFMCADCHSTDVRKNYDQAGNSFKTTWKDITVGCEACHGPGSHHVKAPASSLNGSGLTVDFIERHGVDWILNPATGNAHRSRPRETEVELQVCAQCHSRRGQIADGYRPGMPYHDFYREAVLEPGLYHADGQQLDEVYISGSFAQSKMNHAGVTCSDCHNPHTSKLKAEGNAVCAGCHLPAKYDIENHHHHPPGTLGAQCVNCHMPEKTYMVIDPRRDHSIRIPRPDLSVAHGTPNSCNGCHRENDATWAAQQIRQWTGGREPHGYQTYTPAYAAADANQPDAQARLGNAVTDLGMPAIARAGALLRLARIPGPTQEFVATGSLRDSDPLVRRSAVESLSGLPAQRKLPLLAPLLEDGVRTVRMEAASALAGAMAGATPAQQAAFDKAAAEFIAAQNFNADTVEARTSLGGFYANLGRYEEAERQLKAAIAMDPNFAAAYANLVDLYRVQNRDAESAKLLLEGLKQSPESPELHHAYGLLLVREDRKAEALVEFRKASQLVPDNTRFAYVYAVALDSIGQSQAALSEIRRVLPSNGTDAELLIAAATFSRNAGDYKAMQGYLQALINANPNNPQVRQFVEQFVKDM